MRSLSSIVLPILAAVLFGKFIPLLIVILIIGGLAVIIQAAIKEGRQL